MKITNHQDKNFTTSILYKKNKQELYMKKQQTKQKKKCKRERLIPFSDSK